MTIWFSSDLHFHHANIIRFCNRPFADPADMNAKLVQVHNAFVQPNDHWYNLGDVTMQRDGRGKGLEILAQMNGHKRLIMGNHDHYKMELYLKHFEKVMAMQMFDGMRFTHIPIHPGSMGESIANIHGHIHDQDSPDPVVTKGIVRPYVNICVERTGYRPLTLDEVKLRVIAAKETYAHNNHLVPVNGC